MDAKYMDIKPEFSRAWHNYRTRQTDYLTESQSPTRGTVENALDYIPQITAAQEMFKLLVKHEGLSVAQAMIRVLSVCAGVKE